MSGEALLIGSAIQAYGSMQSGVDRQRAYEFEAATKQAQAAQVDIAANRDIELTRRKFERIQSAQESAIGRSGVQLSGSLLFQLEDTAASMIDEINAIQGAAKYRKSTLLTEADLSKILGKQAYDQGLLGALGAGLGAVSKNPYTYDRRVASTGVSGGSSINYTGIETGSKYRGVS